MIVFLLTVGLMLWIFNKWIGPIDLSAKMPPVEVPPVEPEEITEESMTIRIGALVGVLEVFGFTYTDRGAGCSINNPTNGKSVVLSELGLCAAAETSVTIAELVNKLTDDPEETAADCLGYMDDREVNGNK